MKLRKIELVKQTLSLSFLLFSVAAIGQDKGIAPLNTPPIESYRTGLKSIIIPPPTADLDEIGPDYRVLLDSLAPDSNRLLAAFLSASDIANVRSGSPKAFVNYALVENLRSAEFMEIDAPTFKQVSDGMAQQLGVALNSSMKEEEEELNHKLKSMQGTNATVSLDKPLQLGVFFNKPDACGFGIIEQVTVAGNSTKIVAAVSILRVQNRLIYVYLYSSFKDEASVQWVRKTSEQWVDAILKANQQ